MQKKTNSREHTVRTSRRPIRIAGRSFEVDEVDRVMRSPGMIELRRQAAEEGNWESFLLRHPRPMRLIAFSEVEPKLSDRQYWELLKLIWTDAEARTLNRKYWLELFMSPRGERHNLMTPDDTAAFAALPDHLTIYRGCNPQYARGMSWTTDVGRAVWFADRYGFAGHVFIANVPKAKLLAYFVERDESEAVIDPRRISYQPLTPESRHSAGDVDHTESSGA